MTFLLLGLGFIAGVVAGWALRVWTTKSNIGKAIKDKINKSDLW